MKIVILANAEQKAELIKTIHDNAPVQWVSSAEEFLHHQYADVFIDLEFVADENRMKVLSTFGDKVIVIDSVTETLNDARSSFVRINGWATFLASPILEASCRSDGVKQKVEEAFSLFGKTIEWLPDEPGFVTARIISMIINEAFIALAEGVSTKDEINTAMQLGTAYPYGPFEWAQKIGVQNIVTLLHTLSKTKPHCAPAPLLVQETNRGILTGKFEEGQSRL